MRSLFVLHYAVSNGMVTQNIGGDDSLHNRPNPCTNQPTSIFLPSEGEKKRVVLRQGRWCEEKLSAPLKQASPSLSTKSQNIMMSLVRLLEATQFTI